MLVRYYEQAYREKYDARERRVRGSKSGAEKSLSALFEEGQVNSRVWFSLSRVVLPHASFSQAGTMNVLHAVWLPPSVANIGCNAFQ